MEKLIADILNAPTAAIPRQAAPEYPASPDMGGMSPVVENAPQSNKPGFFKRMLANALQSVYDGNQSMMGNPDFERQKLAVDNPYRQALTQESLQRTAASQASMEMVDTPLGQMPAGTWKVLAPHFMKAQNNIDVTNLRNQSNKEVEEIRQGPGVPVDPDVAAAAGLPQWANKPMGKAAWANLTKALQAKGYKYQDLGMEGLWLVDKYGNKFKRMGGSPSVDRAYAFASARAANTPFETVDDTGKPITISAAQAIRSGVPGIGKTSYTRDVLKPAALIGDIRGGIDQVRELTHVLDRGADVRGKIAAVLADPSSTPGTFMQSPIASSLQPDEQDYVINMLNLKENAMAMRSVLGAGQGSEDLRRAIQKTIPNASTPGSRYANMQLDTFSNTLGRLSQSIPNVGRGQGIATGGKSKVNESRLPQQALSQLKEGVVTTFKNGQKWTLKNGVAVQVSQ